MNKIAIIITTFMRDELLFKSVESIIKNLHDNCYIIVVDQGNLTRKKEQWINDIRFNKPDLVHYECVPLNSGLSYCRNYGVEMAKKLDCEYCLIASDSFLFNESIKKINNLLNLNYAIIGFELSGCICDWEAELNLIKGESFELNFINKPTVGGEIEIHDCDIMRNFFLAKTDILLEVPWDNNLKLGEHEDFFWQMKQNRYRCGWTDYIHAEKMNDRPDEYADMRRKNFNEGIAHLRKKYNISEWVTYKNLDRAKRGK